MIRTRRLDLVPATPAILRRHLEGRSMLARSLAADVPPEWPPELFDREAMEWTLARVEEGPAKADWWLHYFRLRPPGDGTAVVIGCGGYKGPPEAGAVEVGYSLLKTYRGRGFATEATDGLVRRAFQTKGVDRVLAETFPELVPSIRVLERCGFRLQGEGSGPGIIRYEIRKADWNARPPRLGARA
jgi:[ribosomal protein S5]-alanine N-acetyltransferase